MKLIWDGQVDNGKFVPYNREAFINHVKALEGKPVECTFERARNNRTVQQNKYLWGVVYAMIEQETGQPADTLHEFFKLKFLPLNMMIINPVTGEAEERTVGISTASLDTGRFAEYVDSIVQWAGEFLQLSIPPPGEVE